MEQDKDERDSEKDGEEDADDDDDDNEEEFLPGFASFQDYSKHLLSLVVKTTKLSHGIPSAEEDYEYYSSYPSFNEFTSKMGQRISKSMATILQYHHMTGPWPSVGLQLGVGGSHDHSDLSDAIIEANDTLLEQVNNLLDEVTGMRKTNQSLPGVDGKQVEQSLQRGHIQQYSYIHATNMIRPQLKWADKIDNSPAPFRPIIKHKPNALRPLPTVNLEGDSSIRSFITAVRNQMTSGKSHGHPYQYELEQFKPTEEQLELKEPQSPGSLSDVPLTMITTLEQLQELNNLLINVSEFAIDLEHHSYRSFLGIVCLMQLSTRNHDYIIDILELREHMHILNDSFTHPGIVKVLHGADWDVLWLQRDLGLYLVNLFDTHQACRILQLPKNSLAFLLKYCCDVDADKQYQLADWRIRPLPDEMVKYAREDTHYLLYIYDRMRNELIRRSDNDTKNLLTTVIERSTEICLKEYEKPKFSEETTHLNLYHKHRHRKPFNSQQIHCLKLLCIWRDRVARQEDESYGYTLPNHMMFQIAEILPREPQGVLACCNPVPALVKQYISDIHHLVMEARRQPFVKFPHIPNPAASLLTSTPKPRPATPPRQVQPTTAHVIPANRLLAPEGPPVSMAATLNDALCQNVQLQCVYFDEWKKRLSVIEERFLQPLMEAPLMNETVIVNTPGKSLETSDLDASGSHVTNQLGDSPVDDKEDAPVSNGGQDDDHDPIKNRQQNRKRKRKNQSLREMELSQQRKENPPTGSTLTSDANSIPRAPPSKKHRLDNFTPHDYNQTRFADVTRSYDPPAVPYTPYSTTQTNKKQHKKYTPRSHTHQRSGQKSFTYKSAPHQFKKPQR